MFAILTGSAAIDFATETGVNLNKYADPIDPTARRVTVAEALELADRGISVVVATRATEPEDSNTLWAQGGIIFEGEGDSPELLASDIANAGDGLCHDQAVEILARSGPGLVGGLLVCLINRRWPQAAGRTATHSRTSADQLDWPALHT
jgi:succinate dehydrogenase/fumarate reductase flavoprotein subunit